VLVSTAFKRDGQYPEIVREWRKSMLSSDPVGRSPSCANASPRCRRSSSAPHRSRATRGNANSCSTAPERAQEGHCSWDYSYQLGFVCYLVMAGRGAVDPIGEPLTLWRWHGAQIDCTQRFARVAIFSKPNSRRSAVTSVRPRTSAVAAKKRSAGSDPEAAILGRQRRFRESAEVAKDPLWWPPRGSVRHSGTPMLYG
jgi:hypothetical protein